MGQVGLACMAYLDTEALADACRALAIAGIGRPHLLPSRIEQPSEGARRSRRGLLGDARVACDELIDAQYNVFAALSGERPYLPPTTRITLS